ncbi:hypothetical protein GLOTRDRAFT_95391 [Gloeophyllum trabeum ATCC 11539]|uniref:SWIM-type domain-containing protein n=1 Tax=Gloeophyllum trabeum (strain ATCC 11539 / FP-39264 / Madison 617) TaxID=670483 RepID=S7RIT4_GLOTA|nr:uncharacterized protein GLOTRDRAFT_95391 [Gloeophyllum trabeum ATCC 11539]EPQ52484.1 hypothetical protein GLOTRDRAFT_95391 [Gloeophyllum trabeum ATCC 11539]
MIPLHPSVYHTALRQLREGATLLDIQSTNREMQAAGAYPGQAKALEDSPYRWLLKQSDTRSLYRQFNRMQGIHVSERAHINIDDWLNENSPRYDKTLADAVFHYSAHAEKGDRFEICIATKDMRDAAWKYAHGSQVILDGTFGISNKKLLLFIVMGVDNKGRGVPLAFMLFSAPSGNKQTSAGYNTDVISRLLEKWKHSLRTRNGIVFEPLVAITDTDLMERGALIHVFPKIWLLICKFHLRQSWRKHRNRLLRGNSPVHLTVKNRLRRVEEALVKTTTLDEARTVIAQEQEFFEAMLDGTHAGIAKNGLDHLVNYLLGYWCKEALWCSWSDYGRQVTARIMKCPFEGVLPTTNHLESFNCVLKRKHLRRWQRGGRRLREDMLLKILVTKVLPSIFHQRAFEEQDDACRESLIRRLPGGDKLLARRDDAGSRNQLVLPPVAYHVPDEQRDLAAQELVTHSQIGAPSMVGDGFVFECYSSLATELDTSPIKYKIFIGFSRTAECECKDFTHRGGACKHIRAALLYMNHLRMSSLPSLPVITLPTSAQEARALQTRLMMDTTVSADNPDEHADHPINRAAAAVEGSLCETNGIYETEIHAEPEGESDVDSDDTESVATDAPDKTGSAYEFTDLRTIAKAGIDQQAVSRVFYELSQVAPKFADMAFYLKDATLTSDSDIANTRLFNAQIGLLTTELSRMVATAHASSKDADSTPVIATDVPSATLLSTPRASKRNRLDIIGPSPEKAQKRHNSYAPH